MQQVPCVELECEVRIVFRRRTRRLVRMRQQKVQMNK